MGNNKNKTKKTRSTGKVLHGGAGSIVRRNIKGQGKGANKKRTAARDEGGSDMGHRVRRPGLIVQKEASRGAGRKGDKTVLVLRTCNHDMTSRGGFKWPISGPVECPDWDPKPECGNGLHGLLYGEGNGRLLKWSPDTKWLVCEVDEPDVVHLGDKVKFPRCRVVHCGDRRSATDYLAGRCPGRVIVGATVTAGDGGTATAGVNGTATAGNYGTATAGFGGTATAGNYGTTTAGVNGTATAGDNGMATAGESGTATASERGTAVAGNYGTATAGNYGTAMAGNYGAATAGVNGTATAGNYGTATAGVSGTATAGGDGTATAGDDGMATAGVYGTATAGNYGTATAGFGGTATAGGGGIIIIDWYDGKRTRKLTGYIGEDGLEPNVPYIVREGKFVRKDAV